MIKNTGGSITLSRCVNCDRPLHNSVPVHIMGQVFRHQLSMRYPDSLHYYPIAKRGKSQPKL